MGGYERITFLSSANISLCGESQYCVSDERQFYSRALFCNVVVSDDKRGPAGVSEVGLGPGNSQPEL